MMSGLPEQVAEQEIEEMFQFADQDSDGRIGWEEFLLMITPVKMLEAEKPRLMKPPVRTVEDKNVEAEHKGSGHFIPPLQNLQLKPTGLKLHIALLQ